MAYGQKLGKTLYPGQPEYQLAYAGANREIMLRAQADYGLSQVLVNFSNSPMLDYLAETAGVTRLDATPAETVINFVLVNGHGGVIIPVGTKVATTDGKIVFATNVEKAVAAGVNMAEVPATANVDGSIGNSYGPGTVSVIIDAIPFLQSAANLTSTALGAEQETDAALRVRIMQAPSQYSNAGSVGAYKYHAKTANPAIIEVAVTNPVPGQVNVYPLVDGGVTTPDAILDAVFAAVNADTIRPLTDTVVVASPTKVEYELTVNVILKYGAIQSTTIDAITDAISGYCTVRSKKLGEDVTVSQLTAAAMNENVHSLDFDTFTDLIVNPISFPVCTGIFIGTVSYENPNA